MSSEGLAVTFAVTNKIEFKNKYFPTFSIKLLFYYFLLKLENRPTIQPKTHKIYQNKWNLHWDTVYNFTKH